MTDKSLVEYTTDFLEYCELDLNLAVGTVNLYAYYLNEFTDWLLEQKKTELKLNDLTSKTIRDYRIYLSRRIKPGKAPLARSTQNYFLIAIRAFLRYLTKKNISAMPADQIDLGKNRDRVVKFLDRQQLERLLVTPDVSTDLGVRDRTILELFFSTGLRVSELVKLNTDQINLDRGEFGIVGKGGNARVVFLSQKATDWLTKYLMTRKNDGFKPLFVRTKGKINPSDSGEKMRLSKRSVERLVDKYVRLAKLPIHATVHTLRHSFATDLLINGADMRSVQEMLGHKNIATTQIYTHVTNSQLKEVFSKFHDK
ncbi:tyrosine-type recombinase/integrase [Candidatus Gottesmanbacteria bacterium]|nr:tyrosine-type recombinase/integrase [Candidatus Gottesmanbacteria bacterium]